MFVLSCKRDICDIFIKILSEQLSKKEIGYEFSLCPVTLLPNSLSIGNRVFFASSDEGLSDRVINTERFIHRDIKGEKSRLSSLSKLAKKTFLEASSCLYTVGDLHDSLEEVYKSAMDFERNDEVLEKICKLL